LRIAHVAIAVDDLDAATELYSALLGLEPAREGRVRDHYSRHLVDDNIDLALIRYDEGASSAEARAGAARPGLHHIGFTVDDLEEARSRVTRLGCEIISAEGVVPVKFRTPDGVIAEFALEGRFGLRRE
jgi:catechol 2,3-dioxygenase-like lactoylglutathione lyase family enzyme